MKKSLLLTAVIIMAAQMVHAQFIKIGPKAGANLVKIDDKSFKDGFQFGYYAGGFAEIKLGKNLFLMPELLWADNNLKTTDDFRDVYREVLSAENIKSIKLQSLNIPISLNYKIANVLSLTGGAMFTRNMQEDEGFLKSVGSTFSDGNVSAMAGANIHLGRFRVHARYMWGLHDINNLKSEENWKQQSVQAGIGFVF